jgi:peptidylprolyl isomerase
MTLRDGFPLGVALAVTMAAVTNPVVAQTGRAVVGKLGALELTVADMQKVLDLYDAPERSALARDAGGLERAVRTELIRRALLAEALRKGWEKRPEVAARLERAREQVIVSTYVNDLARPPAVFPTEPEVAAFYEKNRAAFAQAAQFRVAQIYIAVPPEAPAAEQAAARAAAIASDVRRSPDSFAKLAESQSQHASSAARGGDLGWIAEDRMLPEVRDSVRGLKVGEIGGPVRSATGWHIVKLLELKPAGPATLAEAREAIVATLRLAEAQANEARYLDQLLAKQPITISEAGIKALGEALR